MKLQLPNQIDATDLNEGEAMLIGLLHMICNKHGYDQWYNMNNGDWRKITFPCGATNPKPFGPRCDRLREHLDFAMVDGYNLLIRFKKVRSLYAYGKKANSVGSQPYELKDIRSIQIWCYLMGLWHGENPIISEANATFEYTCNERTAQGLKYKNFLVG